GAYEYRLRWDSVAYHPGDLKVIAYKNGKQWAESIVKTTGKPAKLSLISDVQEIKTDGKDLTFITVEIQDQNGLMIPNSKNLIKFSIDGPAEIVATDNGDPADLTSFASTARKAFNGLCLVIIKGKIGESGIAKLKAESDSLRGEVSINLVK